MFYKNEIQAIFFSEFHHEAGPKIVYQVAQQRITIFSFVAHFTHKVLFLA